MIIVILSYVRMCVGLQSEKKGKGSVILRVSIFALSIYMIITLGILWSKLSGKQNELNRLTEIRNQKTNQIASIKAMLNGSEKEIIEKAARERLGYVYADEQVYKDKSGN